MRARWLMLAMLATVVASCGGKAAPQAPAAAPTADLDADARARCCAQCAGAAQRDPTGADISAKTCTSYPIDYHGAAGVDDDCRAWFVARPQSLTVGDCRK